MPTNRTCDMCDAKAETHGPKGLDTIPHGWFLLTIETPADRKPDKILCPACVEKGYLDTAAKIVRLVKRAKGKSSVRQVLVKGYGIT